MEGYYGLQCGEDYKIRSAIIGEEIRINIMIEHEEEIQGKSLTSQEIEIIELITQGSQNGEIALKMGIKNRTMDFHVSNILLKLGVKSRLKAVLVYMKVSA